MLLVWRRAPQIPFGNDKQRARQTLHLEVEQVDWEEDSGDEDRCDEGAVATVAVGHVQTGQGGDVEIKSPTETSPIYSFHRPG